MIKLDPRLFTGGMTPYNMNNALNQIQRPNVPNAPYKMPAPGPTGAAMLGNVFGEAANALGKNYERSENKRRWDAENARAQGRYDMSKEEHELKVQFQKEENALWSGLFGKGGEGKQPVSQAAAPTPTTNPDGSPSGIKPLPAGEEAKTPVGTKEEAAVKDVKTPDIVNNVKEKVSSPSEAVALAAKFDKLSQFYLSRGKMDKAKQAASMAQTYRDRDPNSLKNIKERVEIKKLLASEKILNEDVPDFSNMTGEQIAQWQSRALAAGLPQIAKLADPYINTDSYQKLGKKAEGKLDEDVIQAGEIGAELDNLFQQYDPQLLTLRANWGKWGLDKLEQLDPSLLTPEQREFVQKKQTFDTDSVRIKNRIIKFLSGAAVSDHETKRLERELADAALDGPSTFIAKLKSMQSYVNRVGNRIAFMTGPQGYSREKAIELIKKGKAISMDKVKTERKKLYSRAYAELKKNPQNRNKSDRQLKEQAMRSVDEQYGFRGW